LLSSSLSLSKLALAHCTKENNTSLAFSRDIFLPKEERHPPHPHNPVVVLQKELKGRDQ
jgi:hypothetical protein